MTMNVSRATCASAASYISRTGTLPRRPPEAALGAAVVGALVEFAEALHVWQERWRQRHRLLALDDRLLQDIGLSRSDAEEEARKPFWRP
ncbi:MAG: DUF1127 domain-containing protein [Alphaproteobacteria bacterium]